MDKLVDELCAVAAIATLRKVGVLALPAKAGVRQLEWPQELVHLTEVGAHGNDLVNDVLDANDAVLAEMVGNDLVARDWQTLTIDLCESTLEYEFAHALEVWIAISDERLNTLEHVDGSVGETNKDTIVDLTKAEELQNLARLGVDAVDTMEG